MSRRPPRQKMVRREDKMSKLAQQRPWGPSPCLSTKRGLNHT